MSKKYLITKAHQNKKAIPAFNVSSIEALKAVFSVSSKYSYPVFIETSRGEAEYLGPELLGDICKSLSKLYNIDYILHLDRSNDLEFMERCLKAGYDSISAEFGNLEEQEILKLSQKAKALTEKYDAILEGVMEVVPIVYYENNVQNTPISKLDFATKFVTIIKPDMLCVSIGTQSGGKKDIKNIDYSLLQKLQSQFPDLPLMIHGGSFLEDDIVQKLKNLGVTKININAELRYAYTNTLKQNILNNPEEYAPYRLLAGVEEQIVKVIEKKIITMSK